MSLLGIDLGTGAAKGVAFDYSGNVLCKSERDYQTFSRHPGWCELEAEKFIQAICEITHELSAQLQEDPVAAMAISCHGETVIPTARDGSPIAPAFMNADNRAFAESAELEARVGRKRLYEITGTPPHPMYGLTKIMWFRKHDPEGYARTYKFCAPEDFVLMNLGVEPVCNHALCSRYLMFDIHTRQWSQEILDAAGVDIDKLSRPVLPGTIVGRLDREHAERFGLREGVTVVSGGFDHFSCSIGAGIIRPGAVSCSAGTYEGLTTLTTAPNTSDAALACCLNTFCHLDGLYANFAYFTAGICTKWYVNQFCGEDRIEAARQGVSVYDVLNHAVAQLPDTPTNVYVAPHLVGSCNPYNDPKARGFVYGMTPDLTRHGMYKAVYEGIAFEFAEVCRLMADMAQPFETVRISGGGARADFTLRLRAATSGRRLEQLETNEAPCLGVAILAGVAIGVFSSIEDGIRKTLRVRKTVEPDSALAEQYQAPMQTYHQLYHALEPVRSRWTL